MCTGLEIAALIFSGASTAYGISENRQQGKERKRLNDYQAQLAEADAQAEREAGEATASRIRRAGTFQQSEARAALSASGVEIGAGTPLLIEREIARGSEADALAAILQGTRGVARSEGEASLFRMAGRNAVTAGNRAAFGSLLSGGAQATSGWKTSKRRTDGVVQVGDV